MKTEVLQQHRWLQQLLGEWTFECEMQGPPGQVPEKSSGTESVRALGDIWVIGDGRSTMPDGDPCSMQITLGFNADTQRFTGSWVGSMMTHMWIYDGELDPGGRILTLSSTGPDYMNPGQTRVFHDVIEIVDADHRVMRSEAQGPDGVWTPLMTARYARR
ncbi:DUF1579 domain-containing protein [Jeongeupia chitinilytica]|uniref:DUF1579 domain-containing protein n=1 Tax=Jeongeupia chitinilytica TaxID=1041641 RepID=A0ABQ3GX65_9NEIS|nr:DUF1579 domain-containing protein [Jeongeupia chitinilytica]GHD58004.1 hypothetical protein GCM10007350_07170 [Jeongeupia chitinilytica]